MQFPFFPFPVNNNDLLRFYNFIVITLDRAHAEDALLPIARVADLHEKKSVQLHSSDKDTYMVDQSEAGEFYIMALKYHCTDVDHLIVLALLVVICQMLRYKMPFVHSFLFQNFRSCGNI